MRLSPRITRNMCSGLTVVSRSSDRFILSFVHVVPNVPGTRIGSHIILAPRRTTHLFHTLRSGLGGCRVRFNGVGGIRDNGNNNACVPPVFNDKRTWLVSGWGVVVISC